MNVDNNKEIMNHKKFHSDGFTKAEGSTHLNAGGHGGGGHGFGGGGYYGGRGYYGYGYPVGYGYPYVFVDNPPNAEELADNQKPVTVNQLNNADVPAVPATIPTAAVPEAPKKVASGTGGSDIQPARTGIKTETVTLLVGAALCSVAIYVLLKTKKII